MRLSLVTVLAFLPSVAEAVDPPAGSPKIGPIKLPAKAAINIKVTGKLTAQTVFELEELTVEARAPRRMRITKYYLEAGTVGRFRLHIPGRALDAAAEKLTGKAVTIEAELVGLKLLNTGRAMPGEGQAFLRVKSIKPGKPR